jgi:DNA-binding response OmpR family regulator
MNAPDVQVPADAGGTVRTHAGRRAGDGAGVLVVDDQPVNAKLLVDLLSLQGYAVRTAADGASCLAELARTDRAPPDLVLLDVMMPGMDGFEVCRRMREDERFAAIPVVMVTALDANEERVRGLEAGADDFLSKPINHAELLARVRSLLRVKSLFDKVESQAAELAGLNATLEARIAEEVAKNERLVRLKRFLSPALADRIVAGGADDPLASHRCEIAVVFIDLRGFTAFAEATEPEVVMRALRDFHATMGRLVTRFGGTLERFTGDGMVVFFNDPEPIQDPPGRAMEFAVAMRAGALALAAQWSRQGFQLGAGIGVALGYATLGAIGYEDRIDYGAIGTVTNLAARLCAEAPSGEIYVAQRVVAGVDGRYDFELIGEVTLRGLARPQRVYRTGGAPHGGTASSS